MEDYVSETKIRKRVRPDSESDSYESKRVRDEPEVTSPECNRVESDVPELNDILDILDEPDTVTDREQEIQDLDSVIKSFEEEILHPVPEPESDSGELGYLLEASDYELGLPPAISPTDEKLKEEFTDLANNTSDVFGFEENVGFENEIPSYGPLGIGLSEETEGNSDGGGDGDGDGEFVTVGGLFDYSEESDFGEFSWRPESLPAQ